jgi:hypothetical protein
VKLLRAFWPTWIDWDWKQCRHAFVEFEYREKRTDQPPEKIIFSRMKKRF